MPLPTINYQKYALIGVAFATISYILIGIKFFYSYYYNYNIFTENIRFKTFRYVSPIINAALFFKAIVKYILILVKYKTQILKINFLY
jgi:hypothetical protein